MTPGRPSPPFLQEYLCAPRRDRPFFMSASRSRNSIRGENLRTGARANPHRCGDGFGRRSDRRGCVSEILRWFARRNVTNNRPRIRSQIHATILRTIRRNSHSIVCCDDTVIACSICAPNLSSSRYSKRRTVGSFFESWNSPQHHGSTRRRYTAPTVPSHCIWRCTVGR